MPAWHVIRGTSLFFLLLIIHTSESCKFINLNWGKQYCLYATIYTLNKILHYEVMYLKYVSNYCNSQPSMFCLWLTTTTKHCQLSYPMPAEPSMEHIPNFVVDFKYHTTKVGKFTHSVLDSKGMLIRRFHLELSFLLLY